MYTSTQATPSQLKLSSPWNFDSGSQGEYTPCSTQKNHRSNLKRPASTWNEPDLGTTSTPDELDPGFVVSAQSTPGLYDSRPGPVKRKRVADRDGVKSLTETSSCADHTSNMGPQYPVYSQVTRKHGLEDQDEASTTSPSVSTYSPGNERRTTKRLRMARHPGSPDASVRPWISDEQLPNPPGLQTLSSNNTIPFPPGKPNNICFHPDLRFLPQQGTVGLATSASDLEHGRLIDMDTGEVLEAFQSRPPVRKPHTAEICAHSLTPTQETDKSISNRNSRGELNANPWPSYKITTQPHNWTPRTDGLFEVLVELPQNTSPSSSTHPINAHREPRPLPLYQSVPGHHSDLSLAPGQPHALVLYQNKPQFSKPRIADPDSPNSAGPGNDTLVSGASSHISSSITSQDTMDLD
ncbi:hypothetical protein IWQ62_001813 [Dispira parvispora]|uniref:Uncharacterized protein n=1 Tax=Dispira parvispora TaxID=1520584 RepID=A0A9W8AX14_9FUNG|nr:hypothetical protein IWQ62_001813 [Dispira parvispora]